MLLNPRLGQGVSLDGRGNLVLRTGGGALVEQAPVLYQQDAAGARHPVTGRYQLLGGNQVGFQIGAYDHTRPLVIDPLLGVAFSTYLGGSGDDFAYGITLDTQGNSYVVGSTTSANFPTGLGTQPPGTISQQVFVSKLNPQGSGIVYTTFLGGVNHTGLGDGITAGTGIALDGSGNVYLVGSTDETDFPATHSFQVNWQGSSNVAFVARLDPTGALVYSDLLGSGNVHGRAIALNATGVYVTGSVEAGGSADAFPTTASAFQQQPRPGVHTTGFVTALNLAGTTLTWSSYLGGSSGDSGNAIAVSASGVAYVSGSSSSNDFPATTGAYQTTPAGSGKTAAFVSAVASGGGSLMYSTYLHDTHLPAGNSAATGLALSGADGSVYIVGSTDSSSFPTTVGAYQTTGSGVGDGFVTHLNASGTGLLYSTYLQGGQAAGVAIDSQGSATVVGTAGTGFNVASGPQTSFSGGDADAFLTRLKPDGSNVSYAGFLGGNGRDEGNAVALDGQGDAFVAGSTTSTNLVNSTGNSQLPYSGNFDAFVLEVLGSPWTLNGSYSVKPNGTLSVPANKGVLANAVSPGGRTLTVSQYTYNGPGSLTLNPDGSFTYTPLAGFSGTDSFSYVASDGTQTAAPTPVTITIGNPVAFPIYGTGQADDGSLLAGGATDTHYQLLTAPETIDATAPYVTMQNSFPFIPGYWVGDGPNSKWISPHANENDQGGGFSDALGDYTYRITFDLSGYDPSTALLVGQVSGDNTLKVLLNGWQSTSGTSSHRAYVLAGAPADGVTLYHTVVDVGTRAASGLTTAANRDQIIANVKTAFRADVRQVEGPQKILTYYNKWTVIKDPGSSRTTATLLKASDGNCEAWVAFFRDVLRSQGIGSTVITDYKMAPKASDTVLLFVKNWGLEPGGALRIVYPADGEGPVNLSDNQYRWIDELSGVKKNPGVAGKGNPDPLAVFQSHMIIQITIGAQAGLFDPSYGITATDFPDYAAQAFDFVGRAARLPGTENVGVTLTRVTRDNANNFIRRIL